MTAFKLVKFAMVCASLAAVKFVKSINLNMATVAAPEQMPKGPTHKQWCLQALALSENVFSMDRYHHGPDSYAVPPHCDDAVIQFAQ